MTRKEETKIAAAAYVEKWYKEHDMRMENFPTYVACSKGDFKAGAEWADKTMIEKACEFFAPYIRDNSGGYERETIFNDFRKAMKG